MEEEDVKTIEIELVNKKGQKINILEWGSGGSTIYFSNFLEKNGIIHDWYSIDNSPIWYRSLLTLVFNKPYIHLYLSRFNRFNIFAQFARNKYINFPKKIGTLFDVIIIDGRERARCLLLAKHLLKSNGTIFLHDAERLRYKFAMMSFPISEIVSQPRKKTRLLWRGNINK
jgi:hypothetical protein